MNSAQELNPDRELINQWLSQQGSLRGLMACGLRYPDETVFIPSISASFPQEKVGYALRCLADTFQVLKLNHLPSQYLRWIYQNALLYCVKRADGVFVAVFTSREADSVDLGRLGKLLAEFPRVGGAGAT